MKSLSLFVNESLSNKQKELIGEVFSCMFKNTKLNKDHILSLLSNLNKDIIFEISKYFSENESQDYLSYDPGEDTFLKYDDNKEKILSQLSEYISKFKI